MNVIKKVPSNQYELQMAKTVRIVLILLYLAIYYVPNGPDLNR